MICRFVIEVDESGLGCDCCYLGGMKELGLALTIALGFLELESCRGYIYSM